MSWLGWLTKGSFEVSTLDRFICLGELVGLVVAIVFIFVMYMGVTAVIDDTKERWSKK